MLTKKKIILIVLMLGMAGWAFYMLKNGGFMNMFLTPEPKCDEACQAQKVSAFGMLGTNKSGPTTTNTTLSPEIEEQFKNDPMGKKVFMIGWNVLAVEEPEVWIHQENAFIAKVLEYDPTNNTLKISVTKPNVMPFFEQEKVVQAPTDCTDKNTYITLSQGRGTSTNKKFYDQVEVGDFLVSFCTDAECSKIGKLCKLIKQEFKTKAL